LSFERTIALPPGIDTDNAKAKFKRGVLKMMIPKKPEAQSSRRKIELTTYLTPVEDGASTKKSRRETRK
jgi:hypothetical protein